MILALVLAVNNAGLNAGVGVFALTLNGQRITLNNQPITLGAP